MISKHLLITQLANQFAPSLPCEGKKQTSSSNKESGSSPPPTLRLTPLKRQSARYRREGLCLQLVGGKTAAFEFHPPPASSSGGTANKTLPLNSDQRPAGALPLYFCRRAEEEPACSRVGGGTVHTSEIISAAVHGWRALTQTMSLLLTRFPQVADA